MKCTPEAHRAFHALCEDFARAFPGTSARAFKEELLVQFPRFKAEAEGRPVPPRRTRESTLSMSAARMAECITFVVWLGGELGVNFSLYD